MRSDIRHKILSIGRLMLVILTIGGNSLIHGQYYQVTDLRALAQQRGYDSISATISTSGRVWGYLHRSNTRGPLVVYENGALHDVFVPEIPGFSAFSVSDMNDAGDMVGSAHNNAPAGDGGVAILIQNGNVTNLGSFGYLTAEARFINNSGHIAGQVREFLNFPYDSIPHGFVYSNGSVSFVPNLIGRGSGVMGLTEAGQIGGTIFPALNNGFQQQAFSFLNGQISAFPYVRECSVNTIIESGDLFGYCVNNSNGNLFAAKISNGIVTNLGMLPIHPQTYCRANDANDTGLAVGGCFVNGNSLTTARALIFNEGQIYDVNERTPPTFNVVLRDAGRVGNDGRILAYSSSSNSTYLLTPTNDTTPPTVFVNDVYYPASNALGGVAHYAFGVQDDFDRNPTVSYSIGSGSFFPIGSTEVTATARDATGNTSTATFNVHIYPVYQVEALFDQTKAHKSGSTVPIKIRVLDMNGNNVSSSSLPANALGTFQIDSGASYNAEDSGNANPDFNFRFELGQQAYIYNLKIQGYETGTYWLRFRIGNTPVEYHVEFQVRQ